MVAARVWSAYWIASLMRVVQVVAGDAVEHAATVLCRQPRINESRWCSVQGDVLSTTCCVAPVKLPQSCPSSVTLDVTVHH